jgi:Cof subfamily protein (haloacid dehalogenase superfamily)
MGIFSGCLLACDVDGTLEKNGYLNPLNVTMIEHFLKEGGVFSLSTGRSAGAVNPILKKLGKVSPSIVANGCMIYDFENNKILFEKVVDKEDYFIVKLVYDEFPEIGIEIHSGTTVLTVRETNETVDHQTYEGLATEYVTFEEACEYSWNKVNFFLNDFSDNEGLRKRFSKEKYGCDFINTSAFIYGRTRHYLEQIPKNVSKAATLEELKKVMNIEEGKAFAIGDYYNDLEVIKAADIGAAAGNAPDDIKEIADYVSVTCDEGAVADFIKYLEDYLSNQN